MISCTECGALADQFYVEETMIYGRTYWDEDNQCLDVLSDKGECDGIVIKCGSCGVEQDIEIEWR